MLNLAVQVCAELCLAGGGADGVKACLSIQLELSSSPWSDSGLSEEADNICVCGIGQKEREEHLQTS